MRILNESRYNRMRTSETISAPFIRTYGIDPIRKLVRRFGPAAVGVFAGAALEALRAWLRTKAGATLDWIFHA